MSNLDHQAARRWHRLAWLPIPLLLAAIIAARVAGGRGTYVNDDLRLVLSSICYTLVAVATLVLIGRSFLASGAPGLLLLEGYTPKQLEYGTGCPKQLDHLYTREMLEAAFGSFSKIEIREYETHMSEGGGHAGMAAVIDLIGWK